MPLRGNGLESLEEQDGVLGVQEWSGMWLGLYMCQVIGLQGSCSWYGDV